MAERTEPMLHSEPGLLVTPEVVTVLGGDEVLRITEGVVITHDSPSIVFLPVNTFIEDGQRIQVASTDTGLGILDPTLRWGLKIDNSTGSPEYSEIKLSGYALKKSARILTLKDQRRVAIRTIIE